MSRLLVGLCGGQMAMGEDGNTVMVRVRGILAVVVAMVGGR